MRYRLLLLAILLTVIVYGKTSAEEMPDPSRDILVTFDNKGVRAASGGLGAPYRNRKRYSISRSVRRDAAAVVAEYQLTEIEHWPIRSLSVYCFVYRVPDGVDRSSIIERLSTDARVESVQALQRFDTSMNETVQYDDTYASLQYGLNILDIGSAHRSSLGAGVRIAIVDSYADKDHEDLKGRIQRVQDFASQSESPDADHGTAVASVIGARSNNARGIVGIAPEASLEIYVSCWSDGENHSAICDSFTLSKALDAILDDPPHVLNMSLNGPHDPLLERLLLKILDASVVVVAAGSSEAEAQKSFPASMARVIGVVSSEDRSSVEPHPIETLFAPGDRILVALPVDNYDFRSGSSLAAAHVSGVVALLLSLAPESSSDAVHDMLKRSQDLNISAATSVNACQALKLAGISEPCSQSSTTRLRTENEQ